MSDLSPDQLMRIVMDACPGGPFDRMEAGLRERGQNDLADALLKLQQDAGLEMAPNFNPDEIPPCLDEQTANLWRNYEPLTQERYDSTMLEIRNTLDAPRLSGPTPG